MISRLAESREEFVAAYPETEKAIADAEGYLIAWLTSAMVGPVRGLGGSAVLVDNRTGSRTFLNLNKGGVGIGLGVTDFKELVILHDRETLENLQTGRWMVDPVAWSAAGDRHSAALPGGETMSRYTLTESGAAMTASVGLVRISVNRDLTDTGISEWSIPAGGVNQPGMQVEHAPRVWHRKLPLMGQQVIDRGIDLPLPLGIGAAYVDVEQDILIDELFAGFDGGEKQSFPFVSFGESSTRSQSAQLKFDFWLLPFVNIFGLVGKVEGDAAVDVLIDGNRWLEEIGSNCDRLIPPLECLVLRDREILLPIRTDVDITSYGVGTVLAGGWKGWFATVPISANWVDAKNSVPDGTAITITPRIGRLFNIGRLGNMAGYVGGNWLRNKISVTGTFRVPGTELDIDYTVDQQNADRWNAVVGFNWNLSRRIAWSLEYNGFSGSREAWITNFGFRF